MNDELDDRRLRRAVRGALGDIIATAPTAAGPSAPRRSSARSRRRPLVHLAAWLTAAAGIVGIVAVASRDDERPAVGEATARSTSVAAPVPTSVPTVAATGPSTEAGAPAPTTDGAGATPPSARCGTASVPDGATAVQTIAGDLDGDGVDDVVTLYSLVAGWRVHVTSSARSVTSDAPVELTLDDAIAGASVSLADIDAPAAIMVAAHGPNDLGIETNFTFLTLNAEHCVEQWIFENAQGVDEPFEWVALREPGHVTGMICEGRPGARTYRLVDSAQNGDGTWRVVTRILTHVGTRAEVSFRPEATVADASDFADGYGSIVGCP